MYKKFKNNDKIVEKINEIFEEYAFSIIAVAYFTLLFAGLLISWNIQQLFIK